ATDPAREDRHPARGAHLAPEEQGRGRDSEPAGRRPADGDPRPEGLAAGDPLSHVYCTECGFQNPEAANYCAKCGALLEREEPGAETTMALTPEEITDESLAGLEGIEGPAL